MSTIISTCELRLERAEASRKDIAADRLDEPVLLFRRRVELGGPLREGVIEVRYRDQAKGRNIVLDAHLAFQNRILERHFVVRERQQALANAAAVLEEELADAADLVGRSVLFNAALRHEWRPIRQGIEVANDHPDRARRCGHDGRAVHLHHAYA